MGAAPPTPDITEFILVDEPAESSQNGPSAEPTTEPTTESSAEKPPANSPTVKDLLRHIAALDARLQRLEAAGSTTTVAPLAKRTARRIVVQPNWHGDLLKELTKRRKKIKGE